MKKIRILNAEYIGKADNGDFTASFQTQILSTLKIREILTEKQYEKGIKLLQERRA